MQKAGIVAAVLFASLPFAWSCAQSTGITGSDETGGSAGQTISSGGSSATGGAPATGGSAPTGQPSATGGAAATGKGGSAATGGKSGTGGSTGVTGEGGAGATGTGGQGSGPAGTGGSTGQGGSAVTGSGGQGSAGPSTGGSAGHGSTTTGAGSATGTGGSATTGAGGSATTGAGGSPTTGAGGSPTTGAGGTGATSSTAGGTIVPLYTDPSDPSWDAVIIAAQAHPTVRVVAIVNPNNGPGSSKSSSYTAGIAALQAANIKVIAYVATGYGSHSIASMEAEMDTWKSFYPTVQGVFFDEQSNAASDVPHYQTLAQYAKSIGLGYTVGNPGTDVAPAYVGVLDTMLIYESDGVPAISSLAAWSSYAPSNFGVIPYAVSSMNTTFVQQARQYVEYIYVTNDNLPNPWDSLTSYFSQLLTALE